MNITLRLATKEDVPVLSKLSIDTFIESYAEQNTSENTALYIDRHFKPEQVERDLNDPGNKVFLAFSGSELAGYIKLSNINQPEKLKGSNNLEIERLYVLKQYQEQKIGATLMSYSLSYAIKNGFDTLWLGVWIHNEKAIAFYKRWDFEEFGEHIFQFGNDPQTDLLMKRKC